MDKQLFKEILDNMPGSFKSKLERIRRYLHLGKASVMIGAGFSCNADIPSHIKVKKWADVGEDIYCRLNNAKKADASKLIFKTPMRLASQFAASFGRSELDNLIKDSIPDDRMKPGALHRQLLSLPWRDVFTTNYDTLLERAREGLVRTYSVVTSKEMLLYKKSPRIIKLHGSFPDKTPFLMTEEDFRTYPAEHPEFVNTVRQALVESIFCLIGFSGDDPNFISWQGWLRDVMGEYAGPSYLITCDKEYDESFKTLMEHRGIEVLNLSEIKGLQEYKTALDFFFTYLSEREPEWSGAVHYDIRNLDAENLISQIKEVRLSYPGWFILPKKYYNDFIDASNSFPYLETAFKNIEDKYKESLLFELDWRADISLTFKDHDWYRQAIEAVIAGYENNSLSSEAISLGISLLRLYRHHPEKQPEALALRERLQKEKTRMTELQLSRYYYTIACTALSLMDYDRVQLILSEWNLSPSNYEGVIYKSLVLAECSDLSMATKLLSDALEKITQSLAQITTEEEQSQHCVIETLLSFYNRDGMREIDPRFSFTSIKTRILQDIKPERESLEVKHGYGIGAGSRTWNMGSGIRPEMLYPYRYLLLCEAYGFPYGLATITVDDKLLSDILPIMTVFGLAYSVGVVLRSGSRNVVEAYATRSTFNNLSREVADKLALQLLKNTSQKSCEDAQKRRETEVLLPFLSRLSSSCSSEVVIKIYVFAQRVYRQGYFSKPEDLNIIYNNVLPDNIPAIYAEAFASQIFLDRRERDIPLPKNGYEYYTPGNQEFEIVHDGLLSTYDKIRKSAYDRAICLMYSTISEKRKEILKTYIRNWRKTEFVSDQTRHSFIIVEPTNEERDSLKKQIKEDLNVLLKGNYKYNGSSLPLSSMIADLHSVSLSAKYLSNYQIEMVLEKLSMVLSENFECFSKDDSKETLGGLRHFTTPLFQEISDFVRVITQNGYLGSSVSDSFFKVLFKYLPTHLPVRITMERLNMAHRCIGPNKMRDIVSERLFSENEQEVIDSCNALVGIAQNNPNIQTVLQHIIFYCGHLVDEHIRLYLQTLSMIPLDRMSKRTLELLSAMMITVLEKIPNCNLTVEARADIMHDGVRLAAAFNNVTAGNPLYKAVKEWESYANNEEVFNDVRRPWFFA